MYTQEMIVSLIIITFISVQFSNSESYERSMSKVYNACHNPYCSGEHNDIAVEHEVLDEGSSPQEDNKADINEDESSKGSEYYKKYAINDAGSMRQTETEALIERIRRGSNT
jgi:hypothetical protein